MKFRLTAMGEDPRIVNAESERAALETLGLPVIVNLNGTLIAVDPAGVLFADSGVWTAYVIEGE